MNTVSETVSRYVIAPDGNLRLLGSTAVGNQAGTGAADVRLSGDGRTLYVNETKAAAIAEFAVDGGKLTAQGSVALPAGATPAGVAVQ